MIAERDRRQQAAAQQRRTVDEVVRIARRERANVVVSGGSKPHLTITKQVSDANDTYFRAMLSGIEYATHGHFGQPQPVGGITEWMLRGRLVDVTIRCTLEAR